MPFPVATNSQGQGMPALLPPKMRTQTATASRLNQPGVKARADGSAERGAANGLKRIGVVAVQDGTRIRSQEAEQRTGRGIDSRSQFSPMSSGDGRTAIAVSSAHRLYFTAARAVIVHCLPHAAGMRQRRRNRHAHGDKDAREQKHQQQSGGQAMHRSGYKCWSQG